MKYHKSIREFLPIVLLFIIPLFFTGCATTINKTMDSWVGRHQSELIASWGPPNRVADDGKGGRILIYGSYVDLGQTPGRGDVDYFGNITYTAPQQRGYTRTRMFYVDSDGYIYSWRWQGL